MTYFAAQAPGEIRLIAQSDESVSSSTTLQNDDELFFSADANSNYDIELNVIFTCTVAPPHMKWSWTTLTSAAWFSGGYYRDQADGGLSSNSITPSSAGRTGVNFIPVAANDAMWLKLQCVYETQGTSGTVYFRWAQHTSNATALIRKANSHIIVRKVNI